MVVLGRRLLVAFVLVYLLCLGLSAQDFTLDNEYAKQKKRYPQIEKYQPETTGVVEYKNLVYDTIGDTLELRLDVFLPKDVQGKLSPIVFVHGGGWTSGDKSLDWPMARHIASRGYATFCIGYRLSGTAKYPASLVDVNKALIFISQKAKEYHLDMQKLTLVGSSSGGQMVSLLGATNGAVSKYVTKRRDKRRLPHIAKVVDIDGVQAFIHPDSEEGHDKPGRPAAATLWFGVPMAQDTTLYHEASALNHVGKQSASFLYITSSFKRFCAGHVEMMSQLKALGIKSSVIHTEGTPHTFWLFKPWAPMVEDAICDFVSKD